MRNFVIKMFLQIGLPCQKSEDVKVKARVYFYTAAVIKGSEATGESQFPFVISKPPFFRPSRRKVEKGG